VDAVVVAVGALTHMLVMLSRICIIEQCTWPDVEGVRHSLCIRSHARHEDRELEYWDVLWSCGKALSLECMVS
jgi:hypothetical protein